MLSCILKIKKTAVISLSLLTAVFVLVLSDGMRQGVRQGLLLCAHSVIPSLFVFTAIAMFMSYSMVAHTVGRFISPVTRLAFGLTSTDAVNFLLSAVSGYPVGAKLLGARFEDGLITRAKALKNLTFSVNAGPAFIIVAVGKGVLGSVSDGKRLLLAHLTATCLLAAVVRFLPDRLFSKESTVGLNHPPLRSVAPSLSDAFVLAVSNAAETMLTVSAFVVFFAGVGGMLKSVPYSNVLTSVLEVTVGVQQCNRAQLPLVAFLLGFGGASVMFQVKSAARSISPPLLLIITSRIIHGLASAGLILLFEAISPRSVSAGSFNVAGSTAAVHTSPFAAIALLLLCVVLIYFTHSANAHKNST